MAERAPSGVWRWLDIWVPLVVVVFDQATKAVVRATLPLYESVTVIPGLLDFTHIRNTGAAFGMLNTADFPYKTTIISLVAVAGLIGVGVYSAGLPRSQVLARVGLALVVGGAAGNLIDRFTEGSVVDFVDVYWRSYHFWAFNVADSAITVGVTLILLDLALDARGARGTPPGP
jgi:signal peptidase II